MPEKPVQPRDPYFGNMRGEVGSTGRGEMNEDRLADALDIGVPKAHDLIEDQIDQFHADRGDEYED